MVPASERVRHKRVVSHAAHVVTNGVDGSPDATRDMFWRPGPRVLLHADLGGQLWHTRIQRVVPRGVWKLHPYPASVFGAHVVANSRTH